MSETYVAVEGTGRRSKLIPKIRFNP